MKLLSTLLITTFLLVTSTIDFSKLEPNGIAVQVNNGELQILEPEKCFISVGQSMSRISAKGTDANLKFKQSDDITFYIRRVENVQLTPISIIKLENTGKKRHAVYNEITGKKIEYNRANAKEIDSKNKIMKLQIIDKLTPGNYCITFRRVNQSGNFSMTTGYKHNTCFFDVVE